MFQTRDIFGNEADRVNHLLPIQDGEEVLESVTFNDSHKVLRFEGANDGRTNVCHEGSVTETALTKLGANFSPSSLKEGSSNIPNPSLSLISEKDASALGIIKCSTEGANLDCKGDKIFTKSDREGENDTGNDTLCSDYGNTGDIHNKKVGVFSVDSFVGILTMAQMSGEDDLLFSDYPNIGHFEDFEKMFRNHGSNFAHGSTVTEDEISWFSSSSHGFHGVEDTLQSVVLSSVSTSSAFHNATSAHDLCSNDLPATEPLTISTEFPSSTDCCSLPQYSDTERKGKSLLSELVS
ncbi:hypothetical protein KSP39_PZI015166 [Platanthera zijinensis]|uniref:Uncharacterized protein n=1 Tax=Platanthera zijinensis TaxID=2320716 RepID=A0AAP0B9U9_9ASPA